MSPNTPSNISLLAMLLPEKPNVRLLISHIFSGCATKEFVIPKTSKIFVLTYLGKDVPVIFSTNKAKSFGGRGTTRLARLLNGDKGQNVITFDQDNGSNLRYAKENLKLNLENKNLFVSGSNKNVIDYVAKHKDAIGIIGMNWVSDRDDTTMLSFLKKIKVVGVSKYDNPNDESEYFQPYQAYVAQNFYPLTRKLYVISREPRNGLGTGFAAYLAGDKGQRIVLKSGLYPATAPIRLINFKR